MGLMLQLPGFMNTKEKKVSYLGEILHLLGKDKNKIPLIVMLFLVVAILDIAGLGLIVPYISLIVAPEFLGKTEIISVLEILGIKNDSNHIILLLSGILAAVFLLKAIGMVSIHWVIIRFANSQLVRLRSQLMHSYQNLPYALYLQRNSSEYIYAIQTLTSHYSGRVLQTALRGLSDGIIGIAILIMLAVISGSILIALLIALGIAAILYDRIFQRNVQKLGRLNSYHKCITSTT